jgi:hypothetical protein
MKTLAALLGTVLAVLLSVSAPRYSKPHPETYDE